MRVHSRLGPRCPFIRVQWRFDMTKEAANHHNKEADHHENAARHHREAGKSHEAGDHESAAHHAHTAHGHTQHATHHAGEAAKLHTEHHGKKSKAAGK